MNVAYIYNPYQLILVAGLMQTGISIRRIILPEKIKSLAQFLFNKNEVELVFLEDSFVSNGKLQKIKATLKNIRYYKKFRCENLLVSNDQSILFLLSLKLVNISEVTLIDEGALEQLILRERATSRKILEILKYVFFGCSKRGKHRKIKSIIAYDPTSPIWQDFRKERKVINGKNIANLGLKYFSNLEKKENFKNKIVIATSPLSENNNSKYKNQETEIIDKFVKSNSDKKFILKTHYRENKRKYDELVGMNANLQYFQQDLDSLPMQVFFPDIEKLVGFHSSVVTQFGGAYPGKALSLSNFVGSPHAVNFASTRPVGVKFLENFTI